MSSGKKKQKYYEAQTDAAIQQAAQVSPLQQRFDKKAMDWLNWEESAAPKDITTAPGISPYLDIYNQSKNRAKIDRRAMGGLNLADSNSAYADQLKNQQQMRLYDANAEGLNNALAGLKAESLGYANQSLNADVARKGMVADLNMSRLNSYYNRPKRQPFWQQLILQGMSNAASAASGGFGGSQT